MATAYTPVTEKDLMRIFGFEHNSQVSRMVIKIRQFVNKMERKPIFTKSKKHKAPPRYLRPITYADVAKFNGCDVNELLCS